MSLASVKGNYISHFDECVHLHSKELTVISPLFYHYIRNTHLCTKKEVYMYPKLFEKGHIGSLTLKNRAVMTAMTTG